MAQPVQDQDQDQDEPDELDELRMPAPHHADQGELFAHATPEASTPATPEAKRPAKPAPQPSTVARELAAALRSSMLTAKPDHKVAKSWTTAMHTAWARDIDRMMNLDGRTPDRIRLALAYLALGEPYTPHIESGKALRAKFDSLEKQARKKPAAYIVDGKLIQVGINGDRSVSAEEAFAEDRGNPDFYVGPGKAPGDDLRAIAEEMRRRSGLYERDSNSRDFDV